MHAHRYAPIGLVVVGLAACGAIPDSVDSPRAVEVKAFDYAFNAPDTILAGATTFHLVNQGPSQHHLTIFALPKGMSLATFDRLMRADSIGGTGIQLVGGSGGPGDGTSDAWATLDLEPGRYFIVCVNDDGTAPKLHYEVGMVREFTVQ